MGRHGRARHSEAPPSHWTHVLAGLPWITLVLLLVLVVGGLDLLRPNSYASEATLAAVDERTADRVSMLAADPDLVQRVEAAVELGPDYLGTVDLAVHHATADPEVLVEATAPDPRLAALAADTAAGLLLEDTGADGLELSSPAEVPTDPTRERNLLWVWAAVAALAGAVWMEGAHRIWLREHPTPVPEGSS